MGVKVIYTVVDTKFEPQTKKTPTKLSMLSSDYYKNLDEIILNPAYYNKNLIQITRFSNATD